MPSLRTGLTIVACSATVVLGGLVAPSPASAAPQVGACYAYKAAVLTDASTPAPAVDCAAQHTAETYFVGTVPASFGLPVEGLEGEGPRRPAGPAPSGP